MHKTLFQPSLASCLQCSSFLPSKGTILQAILNETKTIAVWKVNKNCDIDVAIDCAGYQSKKQEQKTTLQVFILFTKPASPSGMYGALLLPLVLIRRKENTFCGDSRVFTLIRVELQALLSSGLPSCVRKVRSCKVEILMCAYNVR